MIYINPYIKKTISNFLYYSGVIKFLLFFLNKFKKKIIIFAFHRVDLKETHPGISLENFRMQIEFIRKNFKIISLREAFEYIDKKMKLSSTVAVITFDDGYRDNYLYAYPILKKFGIRATIFLPTDFIGTDRRFWWVESGESRFCLSWEEIIELSKNGIEFGSHTKNHSNLISLGNEEVKEQLVESKRIIEQKIGRTIFSFCYPYGYFDSRVRQIVEKVGFRLACTSMKGTNRPTDDPFLLKRIGTGSVYSVSHFALRITKILLIS